MRALRVQIVVQLVLWYLCFGFLHGLRRILSFYYHRVLESMGSALPVPTVSVGLPVLGGGFHCAQPHTAVFYLFWGAVAAAPLGVAFWAFREGEEGARFRRWHGGMAVYYLAVLAALLAVAASLALPLIPIGTPAG